MYRIANYSVGSGSVAVCITNAERVVQPFYHHPKTRASNRRRPNVHGCPSSDATALISVQTLTASTTKGPRAFSRGRFSPSHLNTMARPALRNVRPGQSSRTRRTRWPLLSTNWATIVSAGSRHFRVPGFQVRVPASNRIGAGYQARTLPSIEQSRLLPSHMYSSHAREISNPDGI